MKIVECTLVVAFVCVSVARNAWADAAADFAAARQSIAAGDCDRAVKYLEELRAKMIDDPNFHYRMAEALRCGQRYDSAKLSLRRYDELIGLERRSIEAIEMAGDLIVKCDQWREAQRAALIAPCWDKVPSTLKACFEGVQREGTECDRSANQIQDESFREEEKATCREDFKFAWELCETKADQAYDACKRIPGPVQCR